jgi:hypothetical protein
MASGRGGGSSTSNLVAGCRRRRARLIEKPGFLRNQSRKNTMHQRQPSMQVNVNKLPRRRRPRTRTRWTSRIQGRRGWSGRRGSREVAGTGLHHGPMRTTRHGCRTVHGPTASG